jgi:pimeloyl-ACP methyl ester carboxylesterase
VDHWIGVPGGRIFARAWRHAPGRPAILLLHDSLGCVALWRDFPAALAAATGLDVIAYDRLGFGQSDPHPERLGTGFIEEEGRVAIPAIRAALGLGRIIPLGHSVGGGMAVAAGADGPAVVTVAAQAFVEDRTLAGIREAEALFADPAQVARLERHHGAKARWVLDAWIGTWLSPGFAGWTLDAALARLRAPVLAVHGERDEYGSARHPERIVARAGAGGQAVILPGCGHVPHREQPEALLAAVAGFLRATPC